MDEKYIWGHSRRFNDFPTWFRSRYKQRVQKLSVDAGFTCPNRDGTKGTGGCTYCNNQTFNPSYCQLETTITAQLERGVRFFSAKYPEMQYLAYFQAYSNTYAPLDNLRELYGEALRYPGVIGLVIATRPDCLGSEILDFLARLSESTYLMLEIGVESHLNSTLAAINRGHTFDESVQALEEARKRDINTCIHMIIGLPGENRQDWIEQAEIVSQLPVNNLKLHQLQIHRNTRMELLFREQPNAFTLFGVDDYLALMVEYLERLHPAIILERFVSQSPPGLLVAPRWGLKNYEFIAKLEQELETRNTWQGRLFRNK